MRRVLTGSFATLFAIACSDAPTANRDLPLSGPSRSATTVTSSTTVSLNSTDFVPCANGGAGELIDITGQAHVVVHSTTSSNGTMIRKFHSQLQGVSGTGQVTGDIYRVTGTVVLQQHEYSPFISTFISSSQYIGRASGTRFRRHETIQLTSNANGVTADVTNVTVTCE